MDVRLLREKADPDEFTGEAAAGEVPTETGGISRIRGEGTV